MAIMEKICSRCFLFHSLGVDQMLCSLKNRRQACRGCYKKWAQSCECVSLQAADPIWHCRAAHGGQRPWAKVLRLCEPLCFSILSHDDQRHVFRTDVQVLCSRKAIAISCICWRNVSWKPFSTREESNTTVCVLGFCRLAISRLVTNLRMGTFNID